MYFASAILALCVALVCTFFSFASGSGWLFLFPSLLSVILIGSGAGLSMSRSLKGTWISGIGALLCALAVVGALIDLIQAIPFHQHPEQGWMLAAPSAFLIVILAHIAAAASRYQRLRPGRSLLWRSDSGSQKRC
jgi:hypothetical protein